ncbi:carboxylesterase/lipase family protein [Streptomyces catenulae]|uniref:Carboxylic ester hydrolase n=1 Tax=Streptomyces catenulae TaxID=66875 RepID=A0ABV2YZ77_9ACTN|nr:carboxylesterase family protein [Streptomyces catenulae]
MANGVLRWVGAVLALAGLVLLCGVAPGGAGAGGASVSRSGGGVVVRTDRGVVRGAVVGGVRVFQGIPYARPPVGALRWREPRPVVAWRGVRDATRPGDRCAQLGADGRLVSRSSEDCLYLNVTAPRGGGAVGRSGGRLRAGAGEYGFRRPVVVFLHGGAFSSGAGSDYGARRLAVEGGVVVVTVNSRLGVFGYFGHRGLVGSGTFGLVDQQAALRWVRDNAVAFGGDPRRVTLAGQSSGGAGVCGQLVSPAARGLFQRAVVQSGSCAQNWPGGVMTPGGEPLSYWAPRSVVDARGRQAAVRLGCGAGRRGGVRGDRAVVACLRRVTDLPRLLGENGGFLRLAFRTPALPLDPMTALRRGRFNRVPVLQGNTRDEHRVFAALFDDGRITPGRYRALLGAVFGPQLADRVRRVYPVGAYVGEARRSRFRWPATLAWAAVGTDRGWVCPTLAADRLLARQVSVYSYEFADLKAPDMTGIPAPGFPSGAGHGSELPYLFDLGGSWHRLDASQRRLAGRMVGYWARFARTGDPNGPGLPGWEPFTGSAAHGGTLSLGPGAPGGRGGIAPVDAAAEHHCGFWRAVGATG